MSTGAFEKFLVGKTYGTSFHTKRHACQQFWSFAQPIGPIDRYTALTEQKGNG